jgi:primosomal protein N'
MNEAWAKARLIAETIRPLANDLKVEIRGPAKAPIERVRGRWRIMILLLARSGRALGRVCREARKVKTGSKVDFAADVDPSAVL